MKKKIALLAFACLTLSSCGKKAEEDNKLTIYTSFYPIYDFTRRICKEKANVINITPAGSEPHDYEPSAKEVAGLSSADLIFVNGLGLESYKDKLPQEKMKVVTSGISVEQVNGVEDPHAWLNPRNAITYMKNIKDALVSIDSTDKDYFDSNFEEASYLFHSLDKSFQETTAAFGNKHIVVSHAAFGYLCTEYGLTQHYVDGISPDEEPTAKGLQAIIDEVKEYNITTVFSEELVSPEICEKVAKETGCAMETLNPLEGLTEQEMEYEDYVSVMVENIQKLEKASQKK
ncbi:MAG: zinc ABC transporter substrate-binding protein [Bacilli bacterium]